MFDVCAHWWYYESYERTERLKSQWGLYTTLADRGWDEIVKLVTTDYDTSTWLDITRKEWRR